MLHPSVVPQFSDRYQGLGLFTRTRIPEGTIVWHPSLSSMRISPGQAVKLRKLTYDWLEELGYRLQNQDLILPAGWSCLFNHSCSPNVVDYGVDFGIAAHDIQMGEELTIDYSTFVHNVFQMKCHCGAACCRHVISGTEEGRRHRPVRHDGLDRVRDIHQPLHGSLIESSRSYAQLLAGRPGVDVDLHSVCDVPRRLVSDF
ncbi:SET domain-containing protein (plasmid) [Burkholderia gladioli]|uniref:SET domain-containing protein-lysine N-methyltransferase n=1 Tax=Burkholderia gladioli TaxID=28095 RepID=UPI0019362B1E|nr:SET domain-containing protein [Burkholderia gladioli]